jgi:hypothetical protein
MGDCLTKDEPYGIFVRRRMGFSGGCDSNKPSTIQSDLTPNGLRRDQLSWMGNCTVRLGGICSGLDGFRWGSLTTILDYAKAVTCMSLGW